MTARFAAAMSCYGVLALLAAFTLDRLPRTAVWVLLAGLAAKTCIDMVRKSRE
jgi:hypothetical protein